MRVVLALAVTLAATAAGSLAVPTGVRACSCAPWPESLAAYRTDVDVRILAGTVVALEGQPGAPGQRGTFEVERVFKGPVPGRIVPIEGGDSAMCGIELQLGAKMILAAFFADGVLRPSICSPHASLPSPEGDALLADAIAAYPATGPPSAPPAAPTNPPGSPTAPSAETALPLVLGLVLLLVVLLFGGIAFVARRGRTAP